MSPFIVSSICRHLLLLVIVTDEIAGQYGQYALNQEPPQQYNSGGQQYPPQQYNNGADLPYLQNTDRIDSSDSGRFNGQQQTPKIQFGGGPLFPEFGSQAEQQQGNQFNNEQQYGSPQFDPQDGCCQEYCYVQDEQPYVYFGTKTAYQLVFGKQTTQHKVPDCNPIQFWSINRHGTRYPSISTVNRLRQLSRIQNEIVRNYEEKRSYPDRGRLCTNDYSLLRKWKWNDTINEQNANGLTSQGILDLKYLARRYSSRFDTLLRLPYSENTYHFEYTDSPRTHDSYQAYIEGLFKNNAYQVHANLYSNNNLNKPAASCGAWQTHVADNPASLDEYRRFKLTQDYQQMVRDVFRRLGFRYTLNDTIINDMYDMCRFEKAWNLDSHSAWCTVFNKEQLKLLEYGEDLKHYYTRGYGNKLNAKIGCPPVKDLYEKFEQTVNGGQSGNKVSVYFTHSVAFKTFLTAMGIAKDHEPLTGNSYYQQTRRKWRSSIIDPFAANLAATLYECRSGERYRVMLFLNEVPVNYPDCSVGLCNWSTFKEKFQNVAETCDLEFCEKGGGIRDMQSIYFMTWLVTFWALFHTFQLRW